MESSFYRTSVHPFILINAIDFPYRYMDINILERRGQCSAMREVDIQPVEDKFAGTHCEVKIRSKLYEGVNAAFEVLCKKDTV